MRTAVISFNSQGDKIAEKLCYFNKVDLYNKNNCEFFNITDISGKLMESYEALIFISSTGIAVRAIAPFIKRKDKDPAVLVVDIFGKYVISLLSGHLGGANELSAKIAEFLGAQAVVTTATDNLGVIAPDIIAAINGLIIDSLKDSKHIAALLVDSKKVGFFDEENKIELPKGYCTSMDEACGLVYVTNKIFCDQLLCKENIKVLKLVRKNIVLGIGCRKDFPADKMREIVAEKLREHNIDLRAVKFIATVDIKRKENAIIELVKFLEAELKIFRPAEIKEIQHKYEGSDFVEKTIGVRAVCEPCAELCSSELLTAKINCEGMTLCIGKI